MLQTLIARVDIFLMLPTPPLATGVVNIPLAKK